MIFDIDVTYGRQPSRERSLEMRTLGRNCLSEKTGLHLVHQLALSAQKRWRLLRGFRHLAEMIADVRFINGADEKETGRRAA